MYIMCWGDVFWMFKEWSEVWEVEIQRKNKLVSMNCTGGDAPKKAVNRWRVTGTRYRPKSKGLEVSEKEIQFLEKQTKNSLRPHLLFPVVVFIIQWIPWILACFLSFFFFHQHQWLCSIVQQSWGWVSFVQIFPNISATLTIPLQMPRVSGPGHIPPTHPPWADHLGFLDRLSPAAAQAPAVDQSATGKPLRAPSLCVSACVAPTLSLCH